MQGGAKPPHPAGWIQPTTKGSVMHPTNHRLVGTRVEIPVHTDAWMRGDRYGEITRVSPAEYLTVEMDRSGRKLTFHIDSVHRFV